MMTGVLGGNDLVTEEGNPVVGGQVKINLQGFKLGSFTADQARSVLMGIRGIKQVSFEPGKGEAVVIGDVSICSPDEILAAILEAELNFSRYYLTEIDLNFISKL